MSQFPRETIGSQILGVNRQSGRLCTTDHLWNIGGDPRPEVGRLRAAMPSAPPEVGFCRLEWPSHLLILCGSRHPRTCKVGKSQGGKHK